MEKRKINLGKLMLIILLMVVCIFWGYMLGIRNTNQNDELAENDTARQEINKIEEIQESKEIKIEGTYFDEYGYASDAPYYIFENGKVEFAGNDCYEGTYTIEGDRINIKYSTYYPPDDEAIASDDEEVLKIVDEETLVREKSTFPDIMDYTVKYTKTLEGKPGQTMYDSNYKISVICPEGWKIVLPELNGEEGDNHLETLDSTTFKYTGIVMQAYENFDNETLEEHLSKIAEGYDEYYKTTIAGVNAIVYQNKSQIKYGECVARAFMMKDGWTYEVGFYSNDEELYDKYYSTFEEVLNTVELY